MNSIPKNLVADILGIPKKSLVKFENDLFNDAAYTKKGLIPYSLLKDYPQFCKTLYEYFHGWGHYYYCSYRDYTKNVPICVPTIGLKP